ncbi:hypothetical protein [Hyphomonas johnsonii]|uniref:Uncharacterized protein n=1 Tax=Hyphomonas johnsonii MHS-2 TaxID=1280950 RepID=A0A059FSW8_9PROT|nr:hypothetical protein [Hyphomonas johnsonii]KCZ93774.1 hypothetical protein HJO_00320 [Hyphomonas johnsonii MHS-2]
MRLRASVLDWVRRGADVAESWAFPEAGNSGRFAVEVDTGSGFGGRFDVGSPVAELAEGVLAARVAEIGPDGRIGPWAVITSG